jgi:hypothetical protein
MNPMSEPERAAHMTFHLRSIHARVRSGDVLANPLVIELMVDDTCWCAAMADWQSRRPRRWQPLRWKTWNAELIVLRREQLRIQDRAARLGLFA